MPRMRRVRTLVAVATAVAAATFALSACSDSDPELAACDEVFVEGEVITAEQVEDGCMLANGKTFDGDPCERVDGVLLVTYTESDPQLWGLVGKRLQAASGELDEDPDYTEAVGLC
jgi:hypothetical protein